MSGGVLRDEIAARVGAAMQSLDVYEVAVTESLSLDEPRRGGRDR